MLADCREKKLAKRILRDAMGCMVAWITEQHSGKICVFLHMFVQNFTIEQ